MKRDDTTGSGPIDRDGTMQTPEKNKPSGPSRGRASKAHLRVATGSEGGDTRPTIRCSAELHQMTDAASDALRSEPDTYQRRGLLTTVVRVASDESDAERLEGTPEIRPLVAASTRDRLARVARWEKYDKRSDDWIQCLPPDAVVGPLLERGQWKGMRPLDLIVEAPFIRVDGTVAQDAGYDGPSACLYLPTAEFPRVPNAPSHEDARSALKDLQEVFVDFPFRDGGDRDVPIAALLTLIARPAIRGAVPMFGFDATTRGAGKSLLTDCIVSIATGRSAPRMSWPTQNEELEKVLGGYALRGASLINFDNVEAPICGASLNKVLTATGDVELRVLGRSEMPRMPWRAVILATGNNLSIQGDTERRILTSRLEPCENPEERNQWKHPNLLGWIDTNRPRLVVAALTVLRAYCVAGKPDPLRLASFEPWAELVPSALLWAGGLNVLKTLPTARGELDPDRAALQAILESWPRLDPSGQGLTLRSVVSLLYSADRMRSMAERGEAAPDGFDELREALETLASGRSGAGVDVHRAGLAFRRLRGRWAGGRRLANVEGKTGARWRIEMLAPATASASVSQPEHDNSLAPATASSQSEHDDAEDFDRSL